VISVGDVVVATKDGGHDSAGFPVQRPIAGKTYRVTGIYKMKYGLGCTLQGMDPAPYNGYFLFVKRRGKTVQDGWYFSPIPQADDDFIEFMREISRRQSSDQNKLRSRGGAQRPAPSRGV
jgi:hypothetical protein